MLEFLKPACAAPPLNSLLRCAAIHFQFPIAPLCLAPWQERKFLACRFSANLQNIAQSHWQPHENSICQQGVLRSKRCVWFGVSYSFLLAPLQPNLHGGRVAGPSTSSCRRVRGCPLELYAQFALFMTNPSSPHVGSALGCRAAQKVARIMPMLACMHK